MELVSMLIEWLIKHLSDLLLIKYLSDLLLLVIGAGLSWLGSVWASKRYYEKAADQLRDEAAELRKVIRLTLVGVVNMNPDRFELAPDGSLIVKSRGGGSGRGTAEAKST
jgi:hypothetical protein